VDLTPDRDGVEIDRRGIDRAREPDLLADERPDVRGGDPGRLRVVVAAAGVPAEAGPVAPGDRDRLPRGVDASGRVASAACGEDDPCEDERED
jgi:hypothetical protein